MTHAPRPAHRGTQVALRLGPGVLVGVLVGVVLAGCGQTRGHDVGPVHLEVPRDWEADEVSAGDDLVAEARWRPAPDGGLLQVIVGCGDANTDQLRQAMSQAYDLDTEAEATAADVPGLTSAQHIVWELRADPTSGEAGAFQVSGLYGTGSGGLVVVEVGGPVRVHDEELADEILASVEVDADALEGRCRPAG